MDKFIEYISQGKIHEIAIAQKGNLKVYSEFLTTYKPNVVNDLMKLIDNNIKIDKLPNYKLELHQFTNRKINEPDFILGFWTTEQVDTKIGIENKKVFRAIWAIQVGSKEIPIKQYKNIINIDAVFTDEDRAFRSKGISTFMYQYLVNKLHFTILGDLEQYFGARKLWVGLSKIKSMQVDVIDLSKGKVIIKNAILIHGEKDEDFDKRIWGAEESESYIAKNYRCILTKINL